MVVVVLLLFGRGKISELMGDMAQGIKAFKKGMSDEEAAKTDSKTDAMKTINAQTDMKREAETAKKFETGAL